MIARILTLIGGAAAFASALIPIEIGFALLCISIALIAISLVIASISIDGYMERTSYKLKAMYRDISGNRRDIQNNDLFATDRIKSLDQAHTASLSSLREKMSLLDATQTEMWERQLHSADSTEASIVHLTKMVCKDKKDLQLLLDHLKLEIERAGDQPIPKDVIVKTSKAKKA